mmetsp:Transcript_30653/g.60133  ORF Transcript_30653/g.60133 Transcript_30653/m.60133 type:complete len:729 (+) Transcript_30653:58-2244(+)|eukprot:CAMPEP_0172679948 /NCGR_PEP_ID=MMETSP1074-20121228/16414_1 /TAXON_ID=2916 /ORGANISM="Ceratium fusus, Strain PA161109" /LENGTH=728 /DNA_ID=CAMNT_0013498193 /DNA_START=59 /DNA_END=2245 /DNA_ORIENTATION=-
MAKMESRNGNHKDEASPGQDTAGQTAPFVQMARDTSGADAARMPGFPGWGEVHAYRCLDTPLPPHKARHAILGEFTSTAICGNDITSSCFYVTGAMAHAAGIWAPFGAIIAAVTLWLFRWVYTEAVTALPFNGGIYNILLNTLASKRAAALVATLTMLSYIATAVVSALSAGSYFATLVPVGNIYTAICLIIFFCILKLIGIKESGAVAAGMFAFHLCTMVILMIVSFISICRPKGILPFEDVRENVVANFQFTGGMATFSERLFLGFSKAMLGVSGFESSANFVEEQKPGVFPKTLRNMWYAVTILNLTFILECVFATKLEEIKNLDAALAILAEKSGGAWLKFIVSVDAVVVLAASILTSYVGFGGLVSRMSGDRCLPSIFQRNDKIATILFMCVCVSWVVVEKGESEHLAACYSVAFLTVMGLFALGLIVLQSQRPKLPRDMKNNVCIPITAFGLVVIALGNALFSNASVMPFLFSYLFVLNLLMLLFLYRLKLLGVLEVMLARPECRCFSGVLQRVISCKHEIQQESSVVYFSKTANICRLNECIQYVIENEDANHCRVVHSYKDEETIPRQLVYYAQILDATYPSIKLDVVFVKAAFGPPLIDFLSSEWGVPPNLMFITCPASEEAGKRIEDLRGVRVIMGHEEEEFAEEQQIPVLRDVDLERAVTEENPLSILVDRGLAQDRFWSSTPLAYHHTHDAEGNSDTWPCIPFGASESSTGSDSEE